MKSNQEYSPKYWVVHDKTTDDILVLTMNKSRPDSLETYELMQAADLIGYQGNLEDDDNLECILIEIKEVVV